MTSKEQLDSLPLVVVLFIVCTVGVLSNLLVMVVTFWVKRKRANTDIFIVNLAIADILLAGVALPVKLRNALTTNGFQGGDASCKAMMFIPNLTIMSSIFTMVIISCDRYLVIVRQFHLRTRTVAFIVMGIWLLSLAASSPQLYEYSVHEIYEEEEDEMELSCGSHGIEENFEFSYALVLLLVAYIIPLLVMSVNYMRLVMYLWGTSHAGRRVEPVGQTAVTHLDKNRMKILKMLLVVTVVFAVLWLPYFILFTIEEMTDSDNTSEFGSWLHSFKVTLMVLSTITNPILYSMFNSTFRQELRTLVCCHPVLQNNVNIQTEKTRSDPDQQNITVASSFTRN